MKNIKDIFSITLFSLFMLCLLCESCGQTAEKGAAETTSSAPDSFAADTPVPDTNATIETPILTNAKDTPSTGTRKNSTKTEQWEENYGFDVDIPEGYAVAESRESGAKYAFMNSETNLEDARIVIEAVKLADRTPEEYLTMGIRFVASAESQQQGNFQARKAVKETLSGKSVYSIGASYTDSQTKLKMFSEFFFAPGKTEMMDGIIIGFVRTENYKSTDDHKQVLNSLKFK